MPLQQNYSKWPNDVDTFIHYLRKGANSELLLGEWDASIYRKVCECSLCHSDTKLLRALAAYFASKHLKTEKPSGVAERCEMTPAFCKRKYEGTNVYVLNDDTLRVVRRFRKTNSSTRLACMCLANADIPGGYWKHGESAQEETLFICTDLSLILADKAKYYPIREFECIYVDGAKVLRDSEDFGMLEEPFNLDVVLCTGYDLIRSGTTFSKKHRMRLRAKIETMLTSCIRHGAETLVLGALGCGKYGNPPADVAGVFRAVIEQYAGYFDSIYFAILDYNTSSEFEKAFGITANGTKYIYGNETISSIRIAPGTLSAKDNKDVAPDVYTREICFGGSTCGNFTPEHRSSHVHPPICHRGAECADYSELHREMFTHPEHCHDYAACPILFDPSMNPALVKYHREYFVHAPECPYPSQCPGPKDPDHMAKYLHKPSTTAGPNLISMSRISKRLGFSCIIPPPFANGNNSNNSRGKAKNVKSNNDGDSGSFRVEMCPNGVNCADLSEEHSAAYAHSKSGAMGSSRERKECTAMWCEDMSAEHRHSCSHSLSKLPPVRVTMVNVRRPTSGTEYGMWVPGDLWHPNFRWNTSNSLKVMERYAKGGFSSNVREVAQWARTLRPVVRMSATQFTNALATGVLCSVNMEEAMWSNAGDVIEVVLKRPEIARVLRGRSFNVILIIRKYGKRFAKSQLYEISQKFLKSYGTDPTKHFGIGIIQNATFLGADAKHVIDSARINLISLLRREKIDSSFADEYERIITVTLETFSKGILSHQPPTLSEFSMGSRYTIPAVLGNFAAAHKDFSPNTPADGSKEIAIVIRQELMFHPDFFLTTVSQNTYFDSEYACSIDGRLNRPWLGKNQVWDGGGDRYFFNSKLHPSDPRWAEVFAMDWILRTSLAARKEIKSVTLADVKMFLDKQRREHVPEAHLPQCIPMEYIERVAMLSSTYGKIAGTASPEAKEMLHVLDEGKIITQYSSFGALSKGHLDFMESAASLGIAPASEVLGMHLKDAPDCVLPAMHGFTFVLASNAEHFLPITLSLTSNVVHFAFSACGGPFSVSLKNVGDLLPQQGIVPHAVTFYIGSKSDDEDEDDIDAIVRSCEFESLCITNRNPGCATAPAYVNQGFNKGLNQGSRFVQYIITADYENKKFTISHWGPSALHAKEVGSINMDFPEERYSYVSFSSWIEHSTHPVILNACEVLPTSNFASIYGLVKVEAEESEESDHEDNEVQNTEDKLPKKAPTSHLKIGGHRDSGDKLPSLPLCSDPFNCEEYREYVKKGIIGKHVGETSHICLYGKTCRLLNDKDHCLHNRHLMKPVCPDGNQCDKLCDPMHRLMFFHQEMWDYLINCRHKICRDKRNEDHCKKYCHSSPKYPVQTMFYESEIKK